MDSLSSFLYGSFIRYNMSVYPGVPWQILLSEVENFSKRKLERSPTLPLVGLKADPWRLDSKRNSRLTLTTNDRLLKSANLWPRVPLLVTYDEQIAA